MTFAFPLFCARLICVFPSPNAFRTTACGNFRREQMITQTIRNVIFVNTQPPLTPAQGLDYRVECQTPARSTNQTLWEFFRKSAVLQGKGPWRTLSGEKLSKYRYCLSFFKVTGGSLPSNRWTKTRVLKIRHACVETRV